MKKVLISFGNEKYYKSLDLLKKTAIDLGNVDETRMFSFEWLKTTPFYKNKMANFILNQPRGAGYWLWKPYIILESFKELEEDDIVLYSDAGLKVIGNLNPLFEVAENDPDDGIVLFKLPPVGVPAHLAKTWTKRDTFVLMEANEEKYWGAPMSNGAISLWKKNSKNTEFLEEWLYHCMHPYKLTDMANAHGPNDITFRDHRHDQSILSILRTKYNLTLYRDPTQWGEQDPEIYTNSPYPQLFDHHRGNI